MPPTIVSALEETIVAHHMALRGRKPVYSVTMRRWMKCRVRAKSRTSLEREIKATSATILFLSLVAMLYFSL